MKHIDFSPEFLLEICKEGNRMIDGPIESICVYGVSPEAKVLGVEVIRGDVRVYFADPNHPDDRYSAVWRTVDKDERLTERIAQLEEAFDRIAWMADKYASSGGMRGPERVDFEEAFNLRNGKKEISSDQNLPTDTGA